MRTGASLRVVAVFLKKANTPLLRGISTGRILVSFVKPWIVSDFRSTAPVISRSLRALASASSSG